MDAKNGPLTAPILLVAGARPNFMKVAPVLAELDRRRVPVQLVHTGQHDDPAMSDVFFDELGIRPPDHHLEVGSASHAVQTARIMEAFEPVVERERPGWVVVAGDVNSTVACALVAAKLGVQVAHIEGRAPCSARARPRLLAALAGARPPAAREARGDADAVRR